MNPNFGHDREVQTQHLIEENEQLRCLLDDASLPSFLTNKCTDAVIMETFGNIFNDIEQWMNTILAEPATPKSPRNSSKSRKTRGTGMEKADQAVLSAIDIDAEQWQYLALAHSVMDFLMWEIFYHRHPIALPLSQQRDIDEAEDLMIGLDNDPEAISWWRKETIDRLVSKSGFDQRQEEVVSALVRKAEKTLQHLLPNPDAFRKHESHFKHDIIEAAVQLHQGLETSRDDFQHFRPEGLSLPAPFNEEQHGRYRLIDIETWQDLSPGAAQTIVRVLFPGFRRLPPKSEPVVLVQPILVISRHPLHSAMSLQRSASDLSQGAVREKPDRVRDESSMRRYHSDSESTDAKRREEPSTKLVSVLEWILDRKQPSQSNSRPSR